MGTSRRSGTRSIVCLLRTSSIQRRHSPGSIHLCILPHGNGRTGNYGNARRLHTSPRHLLAVQQSGGGRGASPAAVVDQSRSRRAVCRHSDKNLPDRAAAHQRAAHRVGTDGTHRAFAAPDAGPASGAVVLHLGILADHSGGQCGELRDA